uniref:Lipid-binding serum glycoprotein N-terminal domain-containing protein n=1 Tax=Capra hircus TaxID=9925 RepID=A0A8C2QW92_CAPHI
NNIGSYLVLGAWELLHKLCTTLNGDCFSAIFEQLKTDFVFPQESNTNEEAQEKTKDTKNLLEQLISGIFQAVYVLTGVNISNLHILDITLDATSENSADVKIPITADITVKPTLLDEIIHLDLNLVLKFSVRVENDAKTGVSKVVMEECRNDQHSISLTVLGSLLNRVVNSMDNLVNEVLSLLMHYESSLVCNRNAPYSVAGGLSHGSRHPASLGNLVCGSHH